MRSICVSEDVYYYDSDVAEAIMEMVRYSNGYCTLYIVHYMQINIF